MNNGGLGDAIVDAGESGSDAIDACGVDNAPRSLPYHDWGGMLHGGERSMLGTFINFRMLGLSLGCSILPTKPQETCSSIERGRQLRRPYLRFSSCVLPPKALHERAKAGNKTFYPAMHWRAAGRAITLIKARRGPSFAVRTT